MGGPSAPGHPALADLLGAGEVACHPFVIGELACGDLRDRQVILDLLSALPALPKAADAEALDFIARNGLMGRGWAWWTCTCWPRAPGRDRSVDPRPKAGPSDRPSEMRRLRGSAAGGVPWPGRWRPRRTPSLARGWAFGPNHGTRLGGCCLGVAAKRRGGTRLACGLLSPLYSLVVGLSSSVQTSRGGD